MYKYNQTELYIVRLLICAEKLCNSRCFNRIIFNLGVDEGLMQDINYLMYLELANCKFMFFFVFFINPSLTCIQNVKTNDIFVRPWNNKLLQSKEEHRY